MDFKDYTEEELDEEIAYLEGRIAELKIMAMAYKATPGMEEIGNYTDSQAALLQSRVADLISLKNKRVK
jgi:hypothetical protein